MIFGRATNLWVAAIGAVFNLFVLFHVAGFTPNADQINGVNLAILVLIGLVANVSSPDAPKVLRGSPERY